MDMEKVVGSLSEVKKQLMEEARVSKSPTLVEALRFANMFLDTTYLWVSQVAQLKQMQSPEAVQKVVEDSMEKGDVVQVDFSKPEAK